jgi:hypothetical protein
MKEKVVSLHCQYGSFLINEDNYNLNAHFVLTRILYPESQGNSVVLPNNLILTTQCITNNG